VTLLQESFSHTIRWGLVISTPSETFRALIKFDNDETEGGRMLAPHEIPIF
jgi:hypothetical protein